MRAVSAVLAGALAANGCGAHTAGATAGVSAGFTMAMVVGLIAADSAHAGDGLEMGLVLGALFGGLFTVTSFANYAVDKTVDDAKDARSIQQREAEMRAARRRHAKELEEARDRAIELMQIAAAAARAGDCLQARTRDDQVCTLDPDFHDSVFMRDVAIARCITIRNCTVLARDLAEQQRELVKQQSDVVKQQLDAKRAAEHDECVARRARMLESVSKTSDVGDRREILSQLPDCTQNHE